MGGVRGRGHAPQGGMHGWGACMVGGVRGREGACLAGDTATAAGGMHPTGMHSC